MLFCSIYYAQGEKKEKQSPSAGHYLKAVLPSSMWRSYQKFKHTEPKMSILRSSFELVYWLFSCYRSDLRSKIKKGRRVNKCIGKIKFNFVSQSRTEK